MQNTNSNEVVFDLNNFISVLTKQVKKRWKTFAFFYLVVIGITIFLNVHNKKVYEASCTITTSSLNNALIYVDSKKIVENFNLTYSEEEKLTRHRSPEPFMLDLKKIEVQKNPDDANDTKLNSTVTIKIFVYDTLSVEPIFKKLVAYCNSNKYVVTRLKTERGKLERKIAGYKNRMNDLIIFKEFLEKDKKNLITDSYFNTCRDIDTYKLAIVESENDLLLPKGFEIAVEPIAPVRSDSISLFKSIFIVSVFAVIIGIFIIFFFDMLAVSFKKE